MEKIKTVLTRYFERGFDGNLNQCYDPLFSIQDANTAIVEILKEDSNG